MSIANIFRAKIIDVGVDSLIIELTGTESKIEAFFKLLGDYEILELGADCGIANDGDADRCLFVDEKGQVMDGDHLMLINALQMKKEGRLHENMVVGTVMSNLGFGKALKENGCQTVSTQVGDRYVLEEMLNTEHRHHRSNHHSLCMP